MHFSAATILGSILEDKKVEFLGKIELLRGKLRT